MKWAGGVFVTMLLANFAFAQQITRSFGSVVFPGGTAATSPNISRTFGSVVFPGGSPTSPQVRTGPGLIAAPPAFNGRPIVSHPPFNGGNSFGTGYNSFRHPPSNRGGGRNTPAVVYSYPVLVGGYGGYFDTPGPAEAPLQQPNVTVVVPPQDARPVIIQMGPEDQDAIARRAERRLYRQQPDVEPAQAEPDAPHYLIAFKDHTIYSSVAYWFDGDTLHYFTNGNTHNQASVSLIDRTLTERLNREMGTDFKMPSEK